MDAKARAKINATTQDHLDVYDVSDDLAVTTSGAVALVIQTNAVNFDLLSEHEQDNKIYAFAGLLNSLNFHIQILIKTQRIDISNYVNYLKTQQSKQNNEKLNHQLQIYTEFIQNLIITNDVLDKKFFVVIPYNPNMVMAGAKIKQPAESQEMRISEAQKAKIIEQGKIFLYPKRDHVLKQLGKMGLVGHQLTNDELIQVFYDIYNNEIDE
jgi:hypothetical protein